MKDVKYIMNCEGDWCGVYVDGELYYEGHEVPIYVWSQIFGFENFYDADCSAGAYLEEWGGRYPPTWTDVQQVIGVRDGFRSK